VRRTGGTTELPTTWVHQSWLDVQLSFNCSCPRTGVQGKKKKRGGEEGEEKPKERNGINIGLGHDRTLGEVISVEDAGKEKKNPKRRMGSPRVYSPEENEKKTRIQKYLLPSLHFRLENDGGGDGGKIQVQPESQNRWIFVC